MSAQLTAEFAALDRRLAIVLAHDQAADPSSPLDTAVTVGPDGVIRRIAVTWGTWTYTVTYSDLGSAPPLAAPANAKSLCELRTVTTPG